MTERDKLNLLVAYRLTQASETLEEAVFLLEGGKSLRAVTNRAYYSMFYAILALLIAAATTFLEMVKAYLQNKQSQESPGHFTDN